MARMQKQDRKKARRRNSCPTHANPRTTAPPHYRAAAKREPPPCGASKAPRSKPDATFIGLMDSLLADALSYLASALYFKAQWAGGFNEECAAPRGLNS
jgi:hypothetical protein